MIIYAVDFVIEVGFGPEVVFYVSVGNVPGCPRGIISLSELG